MQVLGMLPKKERKKKDKPAVSSADGKAVIVSAGLASKAKFSLSLSKDNSSTSFNHSSSTPSSDVADPYAFPDTALVEGRFLEDPADTAPNPDSILGKSLNTGQGFVRSASDIGTTTGIGISGGSMIAKFYPELAEKLEKMRNQPEQPKSKNSSKSKARTSRTMNKLQTKIAQNKINEKMRKSQELIQTDSNSSPIQISSPEHTSSLAFDQSPSPVSMFSPTPSSHTFSPTPSLASRITLAGYEKSNLAVEVPPLPQVDTSFLATLAAQDNLGFQNASASEVALSSSRLMSPHTPPRLPPPYPGSSTLSTPSSLTSSDLPQTSYSPQTTGFNTVFENLIGVPESPQVQRHQSSHSDPSLLTSLPYTPPLSASQQAASPFLSPATSLSLPLSSSVSSTANTTSSIKSHSSHTPTALPPQTMDIYSLLNISAKQLGVDPSSGSAQIQTRMVPSPNTVAAQLSLPPPPPYVPPTSQPKMAAASISSTIPKHTAGKTTTPKVTVTSTAAHLSSTKPPPLVPHCKLHKLTGLLSEKAAKQKMKSDLAANFYSYYAKKKIDNHCMIGPCK